MSDGASMALVRMREYATAVTRGTGRDFQHLGTEAVAEIESKLRAWYGAAYALCVSNATDALRAIAIALRLLNKEFITTPLTWGGSVGEWLKLGNPVRFAGLEPLPLTLSPQHVREAITTKTKAILAVDMFGNPADMAGLRAVADEHALWLISDASQSLGARRDGVPASACANAWVVSFGTGKGIDAGDGAAIITNHRDIYEKVIWETQHPARHRLALGLDLENEFASNSRMNPWTAIWLAETFDEQLARVQERQEAIVRCLRAPEFARLVEAADGDPSIEPSYHRLVGQWRRSRQEDALLRFLTAEGWRVIPEPLERRLLFEQPSFIAQYARCASGVLDRESLGVNLSRYFCLALRPQETRP